MSTEPQKQVMPQFGEPWTHTVYVDDDSPNETLELQIDNASGRTVLGCDALDSTMPLPDELARIVACVNACAGVPTEWLTYGCVRELRESDGLRNI